MKTNVKKEIDTLHMMIQNWKKFWFGQYSTDGVNAWIMEEFSEEISNYVIPYLRRLIECQHITELEYANFIERCRGEIADMRRLLGLSEAEDSPVEGSK